MAQFTCKVCGDGFEQKSRFERHMATSHPKKAPSAAGIEKALSGIRYPNDYRGVDDKTPVEVQNGLEFRAVPKPTSQV